nr:hypothetical protein [Tanacetum cinerariifolium]
MSEKGKELEAIKQNISYKPIDYVKLNQLSEDFGKHFTPQLELSVEQAFWFCISNPTIEPSNKPPVKVEVPSELPKVSLVNASLKKLKFHLAQFDSVVKKKTAPNARTEGEWGFEHTKELLVYVRDTCPNAIELHAKKVAVTPKTKIKKVRAYTHKKNDRISRTPSRNIKNKVEAQPRKVNKKNRVVEFIRDVDVKHSLLKENSELICATCKKSMFDGVHGMCLLDFMENVNSRAKSAKKHKNKIFGNLRVMYSLKYDLSGNQHAELSL